MKLKNLLLLFLLLSTFCSNAEIINVGSGGYTNTYPGADAAGRNSYPQGMPQVSGKAVGKPVPTNDWWSKAIKENHADNLFSYPFTLKTINQGLIVSYIKRGVIDDLIPISVGLKGLSASKVTISDYSDWTVSMNWNDGSRDLTATIGRGMPFIYFTKGSDDAVEVNINFGTVTLENEILIVDKAKNGASFAIYAPTGSTWVKDGNKYSSILNGKDYFSVAFLPVQISNSKTAALEMQKYAYAFPVNTTTDWNYDPESSILKTQFNVETVVKEGENDKVIMGLLPHHWANLSKDMIFNPKYTYQCVRGDLKMIEGNIFTTENKFNGILPTMPYVNLLSTGYSESLMTTKLDAMKSDQIGEWTDSYNDGQLLNRLVQSARIAAETGNMDAHNEMKKTIKNRLENWLEAKSGEVAFIFYYNKDWSTLIGYPAGHGQDNNINDHHFHWGYFIHAAAFMEQYEPGWANKWGEMINLLIRDAASSDRNDNMFPFLRSFSPYDGHAWANGFATFPNGNDQESSSESMQFNSALIHWGTITGNDKIRDLGIFLYTTEQNAIEEYWFDVNKRNFPSNQQYALVSRIWGNDLDNGTFWTSDIAASYGIELYPIHGGSLYLSRNLEYVESLWNEIKKNTGIVRNEANDNLWHDIMWQYAAYIDAPEAISMYDSNPNRNLKFGVSDAQTYYWLHSMNGLGNFDSTITADYPIACAFEKNGRITYVAHNYGATPLTVSYNDGFTMVVPAGKMHYESSGASIPSIAIVSPKNNTKIILGESVNISAVAQDFSGTGIAKVEFFQNNILIDSTSESPYTITWVPEEGNYSLTAVVTTGEGKTNTSKPIYISVAKDNSCSYTDTEGIQGTFSTGYTISFETVGTSVIVKAELLDTDRSDVIAYLWNKQPFSEMGMSNLGDNTFECELMGRTIGEKINVGVKFAYAGGMAVTKYFEYEVGHACQSSVDETIGDGLNIYPNPITNYLNINTSCSSTPITIYDTQGSIIYHDIITGNTQIDMTGFNSGLYIVVYVVNNKLIAKKINKL